MSETKVNSSFLNKLRNTVLNKADSLPDITGKTLGEFHSDRRMNISSGEADIYLCSGTGSHAGERFVLKYYRRENAVKPDVLEKLRGINSPCVAPVAGYGTYEGHQYAVRPYYEMPALSEVLASGTTLSEEELKTLVIPSVITGLKVLHDVGILHKDLKPANLIPDNTGEHIVLIDFGISSDAGKNTFVVTETGMTPFYAAPEAMQGIFHKETDYYALGITVFELFTGFTPFQNPGLTPEETARLASVSKIEFPKNFPEDLKKLVLGLTYKDISHRNEKDNPNRRWGYNEVRRWLNGEEVPVPGDFAASSVSGDPFQAYRFNGQTYTAEIDLLRALLEQPNEGLKDLGRGFLSHHYYAFSEKKGALCEKAETKLAEQKPGANHWGNTRILYSLVYSLNPDIREIRFNGQTMDSIQDLGRAFIDAGTWEAQQNHGLRGKSNPLTSAVKEFVISGIPEDYAVTVLKNTAVKDLFSKTAVLWKKDDRAESDTELALILGYSLCDDRRIPVGGKIYESPEAFRKEMAALVSKDRRAYMKLVESAKADLDFLEKKFPDAVSREALSRALEDSKHAIFGDNEYHFKNGQEFQDYIQKLVNEEKPYEIRSLLNRYKIPLKQVSEKVWSTDSLGQLQKTVSDFIRIGEYLFTGEKSFRDFVAGVLERGRKNPAYLLNFVKAHRDSLDSAVMVFPGIKKNVAAIYAANNSVIVFDEILFPDLTAFKAFVTDTLNRGKNDPGYLLEFVKRHRNTIDAFMKNPECGAVLKPLIELSESFIIFDSRIFVTVSAFEAYIDYIMAEGRKDPSFLCRFLQNHDRELTDLGERDIRLKPAAQKLFKARNMLFSLDEYLFSSIEDFRDFADNILKTGKDDPGYLRRFVSEHKKSLIQLCRNDSISAIARSLLYAGNSVIVLDEYAFPNAAGFAEFSRELAAENSNKPLRGTDFVREHKAGLVALKSTEALDSAVRELQALEFSGENSAVIMVNGTRYAPVLFCPENVKKGSYINFGSYPQNNGDDKEPIEWLVLEINGNEALLISRYGLDCKRYHHELTDMTWENCDLRKWLNHEFLKTAFSEEEQQRIMSLEVANDNNRKYSTRGGNNTWDRVFCLSLAEAERYFKNDSERRCRPTALAKAHGAYVSRGCCFWWLRSPGSRQYYASDVRSVGALGLSGCCISIDDGTIRPALWLIC